MTVRELKTALESRGLSVGGLKADLLERLRASLAQERKAPSIDPDTMTVRELKAALESRRLPVGGLKADLLERLRASLAQEDRDDNNGEGVEEEEAPKERKAPSTKKKTPSINPDAMTVRELKAALASRRLSVQGRKADLLERLRASLAQERKAASIDPDAMTVCELKAALEDGEGDIGDEALEPTPAMAAEPRTSGQDASKGEDEVAPEQQDHNAESFTFNLAYLHYLSPEELVTYCRQEGLRVPSRPQLRDYYTVIIQRNVDRLVDVVIGEFNAACARAKE
jgi:hypothetical protein